MKLNEKSARLFAIPSIALLGLGVLAGCGSNDNADPAPSDSSASASSDSSSTATTEPSASASSSGGWKASESASPSAKASTEGTTIVAEKNKISFSVPEGWKSINPADLDTSSKESQKFIEDVAKSAGTDPKTLEAQMKQFDLSVYNMGKQGNEGDNLNVSAKPISMPSLPSESETKAMAEAATATPVKFSKVTTPLGEAASQTYTLTVAGQKLNGQFLIVPSGVKDSYSVITITSTGSTQKVADLITSTLDKS